MTDNEKINDMFLRIQNFDFPSCDNPQFIQLVSEVKEGFDIILKGVRAGAYNIKANSRTEALEKVQAEPLQVKPGVFDIAPDKIELGF
ncbi:hypothetical protein EDC17_101121 [Sphingobacterium alimentarium]|uniref:Uncharacterized protein n=1 Tax=Sphingobacterium alimentarium TaxID=797292 RepID=A0A4R3VZ18_9SPHI|nr:hypothetical protein [Sphingobacterium alimentarium]TCV17104.1 hypothetical protein EDC17_101121 [Sphingobacterium alimentarium]